MEQLDLKMLQHVRLGHVGDKSVDHMFAQNVPMGITESQYSCSPLRHCPERCIACKLTKAIRPSMRPTGKELSAELGSLVWSDTCGPFRVSVGGYRWCALFVDDSTTWICIFFLKLKSDYLKAFKLYLVEVKRLRSSMGLSSDYHMVLHTNGDSTMIARQTAAFCKQHGIEQRHGSPYLHENQARVERSHRDVQAMARALLLTSGFGVEMWPLATRHAVFILNRIFRKSLGWTSPYYRIQKKHADLSQLRVFGCRAYLDVGLILSLTPQSVSINSTTEHVSSVTPLKTNFMATALDAPYRDPPPVLLETVVLEQGVYLPEDGDEVVVVVKVETSDLCWVSLSSYLEPGGKVQFPPAHTCLCVKTGVTPTVRSSLLPEGVTEPKSHSQVLISPDRVEWLDTIQDELEALV
ncbi:hypothetical protein CYMTET_48813 [Cymbomonas tetramitiformis]|uniref:Integrase catalytic domain-containing protein n=1 Tax=Cymbomonas tetramitiformis TaxID=36881 RepID=A0AAE0BRG3_9CHLO|nr:hypothetical protein CYMTET_48813 [Cymbomonas tetramitiformis]